MSPVVPIEIFDQILYWADRPDLVLGFSSHLSHKTIRHVLRNTSIDTCARDGDIITLKLFHSVVVGAKYTENAMDNASQHGHLEVVKYLHSVVGVECTTGSMDWASSSGHLDVVKYLHSVVGAECTTGAMDWASSRGHLEVVKYLH